MNSLYKYLADGISFISKQATRIRTIYLPLPGLDSYSIKSSITPHLSGDIKIDKNHYITKPVSREDLRCNLRNFFLYTKNQGVFALASDEKDVESYVEVGQMWHKLVKKYSYPSIEIEALNFVPVTGDDVELMRIIVRNKSKKIFKFSPTAAIPIFGRSLVNKHDHEHVTSLLNRTQQIAEGVIVEPSMSFNEEGHKSNDSVYFVFGIDDKNHFPIGTFPTADSFYGENGTNSKPNAIYNNLKPKNFTEEEINGKEAVGALKFQEEELVPGKTKEYLVVIGITDNKLKAKGIFKKFNSTMKINNALENNKKFWKAKSHSIEFNLGEKDFNSWMKWVTLQPVLRRIYGCSFLPDHDYGKGGRGWRDIWQDLLSLILIEPENVRETLINNFAGVRIDGSNATIIGSSPGEFIADRNDIVRVWMDHGVWPFMTLLLYIDQTGDYDILLEQNTYFYDKTISRTREKDSSWNEKSGNKLKDKKGKLYKGSVIEHILIQHLVQFFNVGEHNITRLEDADWNDGLDMASERGESVAFMSLYGGNMFDLANLLEILSCKKKIKYIYIAKELKVLLDSLNKNSINYDKVREKQNLIYKKYFNSVQPKVSGKQVKVNIKAVVRDLRKKASWIFNHINKNEKIIVNNKGIKNVWFNGYYDNDGKRVEGLRQGKVRMSLTGQVFPIMTGLAVDKDVDFIIKSVKKYLKDSKTKGYRLNSDFGLKHYLSLGRAFGFAFGTKENGAFFSHMTVMYAYALYKRGFVKEGHEVLQSIYRMAMDTEKSRIYPGIPEYFDSQGKGMYHYLTGSASWLVLTLLTEALGVKGNNGDLLIAPKLTKDEFSKDGSACVSFKFAEKSVDVIYRNKNKLDYGKYIIKEILLNGKKIEYNKISPLSVIVERKVIKKVKDKAVFAIILDK